MKCTVTLGYDGTLIVFSEDGRSGTFKPYRRTITGARDKHGSCKCMSTSNLLDHLRIRGALRKPYQRIRLPDDRGLFDPITAVDIYQNRLCHAYMDVPIDVLAGATKLCSKKD